MAKLQEDKSWLPRSRENIMNTTGGPQGSAKDDDTLLKSFLLFMRLVDENNDFCEIQGTHYTQTTHYLIGNYF